MYIIHVGFGVRSFPLKHFKMTLILQKNKQNRTRKKERKTKYKKANDIKKRIRLLFKKI